MTPDQLLIIPTTGPATLDLQDEAERARWHYYVDTAGSIYRLRDEIYRAEVAQGLAVSDRAVVVAVEGNPATAAAPQRGALTWLIRALAATLRIPPDALFTLATAPSLPAERMAE
jgi:hypothetical protein